MRRGISLLFDTFTATGSAFAVVRAFKPAEDWTVLIPGHHPGYITWPRYQANLQVLAANAAARGDNRAAGPAREGPALLQGLIVCGRCGRRMTVRYHTRADTTIVPDYVCQNDGISNARPICQHLPGAVLDSAVADLLLATLTPLALEVALTVTSELAAHAEHADALRAAHVQRAQHAADQARRRYLAVDPGNRLVADTLEADWNARLRELATTRDDYTTARTATAVLDEQQRARIRALATDFPALWNDPATPMRERKRLIRLLITDVTLTRGDHAITAAVRLPGGGHHTLNLPIPPNAWQQRMTPGPTIALIDQLLRGHTYSQVACLLNQRGLTSGDSKPWDAGRVRAHCFTRHIPSLWQRLRDTGMLTLDEAARQLHAHPPASSAGAASASSPGTSPTTAAPASTTPARTAPAPPRSKPPAKPSATAAAQDAATTPTSAARCPKLSVPHTTLKTTPARPDHRESPDTAERTQEVQCDARSFVQSPAGSRVNSQTWSA